jgi:hypothetical protein
MSSAARIRNSKRLAETVELYWERLPHGTLLNRVRNYARMCCVSHICACGDPWPLTAVLSWFSLRWRFILIVRWISLVADKYSVWIIEIRNGSLFIALYFVIDLANIGYCGSIPTGYRNEVSMLVNLKFQVWLKNKKQFCVWIYKLANIS